MAAYYNEIEPYAAEWLRNLIAAGHIAPGDVDTRDIRDVRPDDLRGYDQCHFFAGIGGWSLALRLAGWPDDRPVWTGSAPCQPFSAAGRGAGFADERHLWPHFHWLIGQRRPPVVFGEQVASKDGLGWLDLVQADLEGAGYASGTVDLCAAGVGAPHIRQRLWWVAERVGDACCTGSPARECGAVVGAGRRQEGRAVEQSGGASGRLADAVQPGRAEGWAVARNGSTAGVRGIGRLADTDGRQRDGFPSSQGCERNGQAPGREQGHGQPERGVEDGGLANGERVRHAELQRGRNNDLACGENSERPRIGLEPGRAIDRPGPTNGFWRDADWLLCRDGKWRPVEPGTFPLAPRIPNRVGRLRAYGNAIVPQAAAEFISAYLDVVDGPTFVAIDDLLSWPP